MQTCVAIKYKTMVSKTCSNPREKKESGTKALTLLTCFLKMEILKQVPNKRYILCMYHPKKNWP